VLGHRDDDIHVLARDHLGDGGAGGLDRVRLVQLVAGRGCLDGVGQPDEPDPDLTDALDLPGAAVDERVPLAVDKVGRDPREVGGGRHKLTRVVDAEVEVVLAEVRHVDADRVERVDHREALVQAAEEGAAGEVAAEDDCGGRVLVAHGVDRGGEPGDAAAVLAVGEHRADLVGVVEVQERGGARGAWVVGPAGVVGRRRGGGCRQQHPGEGCRGGGCRDGDGKCSERGGNGATRHGRSSGRRVGGPRTLGAPGERRVTAIRGRSRSRQGGCPYPGLGCRHSGTPPPTTEGWFP